MMDIQNVQELIRDTIAAAQVDSAAYFEDADIIADDGLQKEAIEQRIAARGFAVVCDFPVQGKVTQRAPNVNHVQGIFPVVIEFNAQRNSEDGAAGINLLQCFDVIASTLLAYGSDPTDRFELADDAFDLLVNDAGLVKYVLWVFAQINLAATT